MILDHRGQPTTPTSTNKPYWAHGRLQWGGNPFSSLGLEWCPRCQGEVDCDTQANFRDGIYTYKRWCLRCGKVLKYGGFQCALISERPMPREVYTWVTSPEKDRR